MVCGRVLLTFLLIELLVNFEYACVQINEKLLDLTLSLGELTQNGLAEESVLL